MNSEQYLDALLSLPNLVNPVVSRDGKWVAWTWLNAGPAPDVYAAPTDGSAPPIRLTATPEYTVLVGWTADSKAVLVSEDVGGNERDRLFRVDLEAPEVMIPLTEAQPHFFLRGGEIHPNKSWLVYGANFDYTTGQEISPTWIYRLDLLTGERKLLAHPQKPCYFAPQLSPTGEFILYRRADRHSAGRQVWIVDIEGRQDRELLNFGDEVKVSASWFPDGKRILVLAETKTHNVLGVRELASDKMTWLVDDPERSIENAFVPFRSEQIVIQEARQARLRASLLDPRTGIETVLPPMPGNLNPLAPVGWGYWIGVYSSSRQPAEIVRFRPGDYDPARFKPLTRVWERTPLRKEDLTQAEDFHWKSIDDLEIQGWLYRARGPNRGTVVYVHGGPTAHSSDRISAQIQFLVRCGFNVLDPNYRGSTGFGLPFRNSIKVDGWGGREQEDIRSGIEALIRARVAFPGRVGITGTSYGGYSAWHAITHFLPEVIGAAAPICGMTDLTVDYHTTRPDLRPLSEEMMGGSPEQIPEIYFKRSPINFLHNIHAPLLIVQGLQDPNVSPENVRVVRQGLDSAGIPYEILTFADEGHGVYLSANLAILYKRLVEFFTRALA